MKAFMSVAVAGALLLGLVGSVQAKDTQAANAIIDKAIKALGGEEALGKIKALTWKSKGTVSTGGEDREVIMSVTIEGDDHYRQEAEIKVAGMSINAATVLSGDKAKRSVLGNVQVLDKSSVANHKRTLYLALIPVTLVSLKHKEFKVEAIDDEKVGDKPAAGLKVIGPDEKEFKLYFDKETGLPVKLVAKILPNTGEEVLQETLFSDYKETAGIKKAMKIVTKRDEKKFSEETITEFKVLDKVDPKAFTEP